MSYYIEKLNELTNHISSLGEMVEKEKSRIEEELRNLKCNMDKQEEYLYHLNVGGQDNISASRSVLTVFNDCPLGYMFSGRWDEHLPRDKNGNIFIDKDPEMWKVMYQYLKRIRDKERDSLLSNLTYSVDIQKEIKYYNLPPHKENFLTNMLFDYGIPCHYKKEYIETKPETIDDIPEMRGITKGIQNLLQTSSEYKALLLQFEKEKSIPQILEKERNEKLIGFSLEIEKVVTYYRTFSSIEANYFSAQFDGQWSSNNDKMDKEYLILEEDPECFKTIINLLRHRSLHDPESLRNFDIPTKQYCNFLSMVDKYSLKKTLGMIQSSIHKAISGTKLVDYCGEDEYIMLINMISDDGAIGKLLYAYSVNGRNEFIKNCSGKGPTITLVLSQGRIVGGYSSLDWGGDTLHKNDCYLFTLVHPYKGMKMRKKEDNNSISNGSGPIFGGGWRYPEHDLYIDLEKPENSHSQLGYSYEVPTGFGNSYFLFGKKNFTPEEVVVISII